MLARPAAILLPAIAALAATLFSASATAQGFAPSPAAPTSYADVADLAVDAATIIDARIRSASPVPPGTGPTIPANLVRLYVEADVTAVIYGRDAVAPRVGYYVDQPRRADGKPPRLKRMRVLLFARPVTIANRLQLVTPGAQLEWSEGRSATARSIAAELAAGHAPPRITGVSHAFHVQGTVEGESESQIFLRTQSDEPVSLTVLRRPGQQPQWAVAFGEIVDESATVPGPRTLGWYRLACGLPRQLPRTAVDSLPSADAQAATQDYAVVTASLPPCDRSPAAPAVAVSPRRP
jgi:hypothetical protein